MFDFNSLIGLELEKAKEKLNQAGFSKIEVVCNFEHNEKCDSILVCAARLGDDETVTLVCGEFLINLKG